MRLYGTNIWNSKIQRFKLFILFAKSEEEDFVFSDAEWYVCWRWYASWNGELQSSIARLLLTSKLFVSRTLLRCISVFISHLVCLQYLQRVSAGYTNLMQHFSALSYLPMDRNIFFSIQNFINMLTLRFRLVREWWHCVLNLFNFACFFFRNSEVKHVLLQFSGLIIW